MVQRQKGEKCWRCLIEEKESAPNICRSWFVGPVEPHLPCLLDSLVILFGRNTLRAHLSATCMLKINLIMKRIMLAVYSVS
jgi:hypothetical protein